MVFQWLSGAGLSAGEGLSRAGGSTAAVALQDLALCPALLLLFVLPGWTLINALFPRKGELDREYDLLFRPALCAVMIIYVTLRAGFALNSLGVRPGPPPPATQYGYFDAGNLWAGLTTATAAFFAAGWWRGSYPALGRIHPWLAREPPPDRYSMAAELEHDKATLAKLRELAAEREKLRRRIKDYERRIELHTGEAKEHYSRQRNEARARLRQVDAELKDLERER